MTGGFRQKGELAGARPRQGGRRIACYKRRCYLKAMVISVGMTRAWRKRSRLTALLCVFAAQAAGDVLDLSPFARPCCADDRWTGQTRFEYGTPAGVRQASGGRWIYGLQWAEERDISTVLVHLSAPFDSSSVRLEYWAGNWPYPPPVMPTIEDPVDDPWQGEWRIAKARISCEETTCSIGFFPLAADENPRAANLPGVTYRRTVKFRVVFTRKPPQVESVRVFSETTGRRMRVLVRARYQEFRAYNGRILKVTPVAGGAELDLVATRPAPAGSNDGTVIEVRAGDRSFSFAPADLDRGPIYVRPYEAYITLAADDRKFSTSLFDYQAGIRQRIAAEAEQSYERAAREIPPLDPIRQQGDPLYLPLAADASWQKFAFGWGGHVWISKKGTKAFGNELRRLGWQGDRIGWKIGSGASPWFRPEAGDTKFSVLDGYLPVGVAEWKQDGIEYREEAFATLLSGPLAPDNAGRSEQTPAVLLARIRMKNAGEAAAAHLWVAVSPDEGLVWEDGLLVSGSGVRAAARLPAATAARVETYADGGARRRALHVERRLAAGEEMVATLAIPFIPGLSAAERAELKRLDYDRERARVIAYWKGVTDGKAPFEVPEERFNKFALAVIPHMRISATKDPKSGLYMIPAASYFYRVFLNEAAFQSQLLDAWGEHALSAEYLETAVKLQGSVPLTGTYTGEQKAVYHGAKVDAEYDYTASKYNLDHGTVLWTLAEHYLWTRDREWLSRVLPSMKQAADWVSQQRQSTKVMDGSERCPEYGLLPAGHLEDNRDWGHWFAVNAYASVGLTRLAELLAETGDPEAARYGAEAAAYRQDLRSAVLRAAARAPVIRLRDNSYAPYVPARPHQRVRLFGPLRAAFYSRYGTGALPTYRLSATREVLYGPMILLDVGIFGAQEPLADWVLNDWEDNATMSSTLGINPHGLVDEKLWFSQGGMVFQANLQNPIRTYLRRGEIPAAIRNLYNDFAACYYPAVNVFTEEFRQWRLPSGPFYKVPDEAKFLQRLRDALVMEYDGRLLLATGTPRRWLEPGRRIAVRRAPTWYGPVSYEIEGGEAAISAWVHLPRRNPVEEAVLSIRAPEGRRIGQILVNGANWTDFDGSTGAIRLPKGVPDLKVEVKLR